MIQLYMYRNELTAGLDGDLEAIVGREAYGRGDISGVLGMDDGGGELTVFRQNCGLGDFLVGKDGEFSVRVELDALVESQIPQGGKGFVRITEGSRGAVCEGTRGALHAQAR